MKGREKKLSEKFFNKLKKVVLGLFIMCVGMVELQFVSVIVKAKVHVYQNEMGEYYNVQLEQPPINMEFKETEILESKIGFATYTKGVVFENETDENVNVIIERVDEFTTVSEGVEDGIIEVEITLIPSNYEENGEYKGINTSIQTRKSTEEASADNLIDSIEDNNNEENESLIGGHSEDVALEEVYPYFNYENIYKIDFPQSLTTHEVVVRKKDVVVKTQPMMEGELLPSIRDNEIVYPGTNDQSIRYRLENGEFKEDYLVYSPYMGTFKSKLTVENGAVVDGDNIVIILDQDGKVVFYITAPVAYDANGEITYDLRIDYVDGVITISVDENWLSDENRVYPITVDPSWTGTEFFGIETSISYNQPNITIGNPNMQSLNWSLPPNQQHHALLYYGEHPTYGDTISFYKMTIDSQNYYSEIEGKYIRRAYYQTYYKYASVDTAILSCTLTTNYNIASATYSNFGNAFNQNACQESLVATPVYSNMIQYEDKIKIDITDYVRGVFEFNEPNYGVIFMANPSTGGYIETYAQEFYYMDTAPKKYSYPSIIIEYTDVEEVSNNYNINETTINLRPFVINQYDVLYTSFWFLGIDGVAKRNSNINLEIKQDNSIIHTANTKSNEGAAFIYPKYQVEEENVQNYDEFLESNYQFGGFGDLETGLLYDVFVTTTNGNETGEIAQATFQLYEVKRFDLLTNIAAFYGISVADLIRDNNLDIEIIKEGSILFIGNPTQNAGIDYPSSTELSDADQQIIYDYLRGKNPQNEYAFGPVNLNTGNLVLEIHDFTYYVRDHLYGFTRSYNSAGHNELGTMGWGWKHNHEYQLTILANGVGIILGDGTRIVFTEDNGVYSTESNRDYHLSKNGDNWILSTLFTKHEFNASGRLIRYENNKSETTLYEYENGLLTKIIYGENQEIAFEYDEVRSLLTKITKFDGNEINYIYDNEGHLIEVYDEKGNHVSYEYDENHYLIKTFNRKQQREATYIYDVDGKVVEIIDGKNRSKTIDYFATCTVETDAKGNERKIYFDEYRQTIRISEANGSFSVRRYDMGWIKNKEENGVFYLYEYDYKGNLLYKERLSDHALETYEYDQNSNLIRKVDVLGNETTYEYDSRNNLTKETDAMGNSTFYEYRGGKTVGYPEIEWWVAQTGNLGQFSINSEGVGYDVIYGPYSIGSVRPTRIELTGTVKNNDSYAQRYTLYIEVSSDGGTTWYTVGTATGVMGAKSSLGIGMVVNLPGDQVYTHIRYRSVGKHHGRNWTVKITNWYEQTPNQEHDENASYVNGGYVCNVGYQGNGRVCDLILTPIEANQLIRKIDALGNVTHYEYDNDGNQNKIVYPDSTYEYFVYNSNGEVISETSREGYTTLYTRNEKGEVILVTNPDYSTIAYVYDADGNVITMQDELNRITEYEYDCFGNLTKVIDAKQNVTTYLYDENDNLLKTVYPDGSTDEYEYDGKDRLIYEKKKGVEIEYINSDYGIVEATDYRGNTFENTYDHQGRIVEIKHYDGFIETFVYNDADMIISKVDKYGNETQYQYDNNGNVILEIQEDKVRIEREYNELNLIIKEKTINIGDQGYHLDKENLKAEFALLGDANPATIENIIVMMQNASIRSNYGIDANPELDYFVKEYKYDNNQRVILEVVYDSRIDVITEYYANGSSNIDTRLSLFRQYPIVTDYEYENNQLVQITDASGFVTEYEYDFRGNVITESHDDSGENLYYYDDAGQLTKTVDAEGYETYFSYDYNSNMIQKMDDEGYVTEYEYDNMNRLTKETSPLGYVQAYTYDIRDNVLTYKINNKVIETNTYNLDNQIATHVDKYGAETEYSYDMYGYLEGVELPTGQIIEYGYDNDYRVSYIKDQNTYLNYYVYDSYGNVVTEIDSRSRSKNNLYDGFGRIYYQTDERGNYTKYYYSGQLVQITENSKLVTVSLKNNLGLVSSLRIIDKLADQVITQQSAEYNQYGAITEETIKYLTHNTVDFLSGYREASKTNTYNYKGELIETTEYYSYYEDNVLETKSRNHLFEYDYLGNIVKQVDPLGANTTLMYNADGLLVSSTNALNGVKQIQYDANRNIIKEINERGNAVEYFYNANGQLIRVKDAMGYSTNYEYNVLNQKTKEVNAAGNKIEYTYDMYGSVIEENYNNNRVKIEYVYSQNKHDLVQKNEIASNHQYIVSYVYNNNGDLIQSHDNVSVTPISINTYDNWGNLTSNQDAEGNITVYSYDALNQAISSVRPNGITQEYYLDGKGKPEIERIYSANGALLKETIRVYDGFGRETSTILGERVNSKEYDNNDNVLKEIDTYGNELVHQYDLLGREVKTIFPDGTYVRTEYNVVGSVLFQIDPEGNEIYYVYNAKELLIQEENARGYLKTYGYNSIGQLIDVQDERGSHTVYDYDKYGNMVLESTNNRNITYVYDALNRLIKVNYYDDTNEQFGYDLRGNVISKKEKSGNQISYLYDNNNRVVETEYEDEIIYISYDELGNIVQIENSDIVEEFIYDDLSQLIEFVQGEASVQYEYDLYGNQTKMVYPDLNEVNYVYDLQGKLLEVTDVNGRITTYVYNNMNRVIEKHTTDLPSEYYTYTVNGQIKEIYTAYNDSESKYLMYKYDEVGNLIEYGKRSEVYSDNSNIFDNLIFNYNKFLGKEESIETITKILYEVIQYEYNERDELIKETKSTVEGTEESIEYAYNIHGDRIEISQGELSKIYSYNNKGQLSEVHQGSNITYYTYNGNGDVTKESKANEEKVYTHNGQNQLVGVVDYNGTQITYDYDALGNRISESVEKDNQSPIHMQYVNNVNLQYPEVISMTKNQETINFSYGLHRLSINDEYYYYDGLGSVTQILDTEGNIVKEYSYAVDGVRNVAYDPYIEDNMYGYRGEAHTADGLQYLRARYYDPKLGRFLMWDEYEGKKKKPKSKNRYTYGENNSNKFNDPSGHASQVGAFVNPLKTTAGVKTINNTPAKNLASPLPATTAGVKSTNNTPAKNLASPLPTTTSAPISNLSSQAATTLTPVIQSLRQIMSGAMKTIEDAMKNVKENNVKLEYINQLDDSIKALFLGENPMLQLSDFEVTNDGMFVINKDLYYIVSKQDNYRSNFDGLTEEEIQSFNNYHWDNYYGWYIYGIIDSNGVVAYSLCKMKEATAEKKQDIGETTFRNEETGFAVSFVELDINNIRTYLENPIEFINYATGIDADYDYDKEKAIDNFIKVRNGVTTGASEILIDYFRNEESQGARLFFDLYTDKILLNEFGASDGELYGDVTFLDILGTRFRNMMGGSHIGEYYIKMEKAKKMGLISEGDNTKNDIKYKYITYHYDVNNITEEDREMAIMWRAYNQDFISFLGEIVYHATVYDYYIEGDTNIHASISDQGVGESGYIESLLSELFWYSKGLYYQKAYQGYYGIGGE